MSTLKANTITKVSGSEITFSDDVVLSNDLTVANDFKLDAGYGSNQKIYGVRVWCQINSSHTIQGSGGITSVSDNGTGNATFNFSITLPDSNYSVVTGTNLGSGTSNVQLVSIGTTSFQGIIRYYNLSAYDATITMMVVR
tara:strand:- start:998 stop:1417 length:420 start_codon:yes stop_codon:yes gene_type:complete